MSLLVWLPLNGDLHNQGLNGDLEFSAINTLTFNNDGKIGKSYQRATNNTLVTTGININSNLLDLLGTEASVAVWVKPLGTHTHYNGTLLSSGNWNLKRWAFGVSLDSTKVDVLCGAYNTYINCTVPVNEWTHLCSTYNNGVSKLYKNGIYIGQLTGQAAFDSDATNTCVGRETYASGYFGFNGLINDVRIYDHCLSEKEVKEIAKGLVLHYLLNNNGMAGENLAKDTANKIVTGTASGTDVNYTTYLDYGLVDNWNKIRGKTITISCDIILTDAKNTSGVSSYRVGIEPALKFSDNSTGYYGIWIALSSTPLTSSLRYTRTITLPDKDLLSVLQNGMYILHLTSGSAIIKHVKVELGSVATPWTPAPSEMNMPNIIYDISGYQNNGNIIGQIENLNISPKYNICTLFNGIDNCIIVPYNRINPDGIFTMNLWFLKDKLGTKNYETLFGGPAGFEMDTRAGSSTTLSLYMASTRGGNVFSSFSLNTWYMITLVRDGINEFYYVNGELKKTIEAKPMPNGVYRIGAWASDTGQNYYGDISDFRIYATALSADDILELYKTSKIVNNTTATARDLE